MPRFRIGVFVLIAGACLGASQGRDFAGSYLWRDPIDLTDRVSVHVELNLHNSGEGVDDAQIILKGQFDDREADIFRTAVSIRHGERVKLNGELQVSKAEFNLWKTGHTPRFVLRTADEAGSYREQVLDLIPKASEGGVL
jgi:hypothetical protein